jgi:hypothetical protein
MALLSSVHYIAHIDKGREKDEVKDNKNVAYISWIPFNPVSLWEGAEFICCVINSIANLCLSYVSQYM